MKVITRTSIFIIKEMGVMVVWMQDGSKRGRDNKFSYEKARRTIEIAGKKKRGGEADKNSIVPLKERLSLFPFNPPLLPATKRSSPLVACCRKPLLATPPPANKGRARVTFLFPHDLTSVDLHRFAIHHLLLSLVVPVPLLVTPAFLPLPRGNNIVS